ncbi:MAG: hypothetical protein IT388_09220 [Nitrospirales bacterium]|nr:hypothetical protein [Nitrospirales bacterium]
MIRLMEGRIRVRDERLKKRRIAEDLKRSLLAVVGIGEIVYNQRTGSLLIFFDTAAASSKDILDIVGKSWGVSLSAGELPPAGSGRKESPLPHLAGMARRVGKGGMAAALALSLLGAVAGGAKLHVAAGIVFIALLGAHMYRHNNTLFA